MSEAPERIWRSPAHTDFAAKNHGIASWAREDFAEPGAVEYTRADLARAQVAPTPLRDTISEGDINLRDWFAGQAMQGFCGNFTGREGDAKWLEEYATKAAYRIADGMMKEREK